MELLRAPFLRSGAALLIAFLVCARSAAQEPHHGEAAVKAAYLYNFTKFVDWPAAAFRAPEAPFVVCALASDTFRREFDQTFQGERVRGRRIEIDHPSTAEGIRRCHLIYFGANGEAAAGRLAALGNAPVLTIGEGRRFLDQGGHIAFRLSENRVRFEISKRAADAAGLQVSSKLLRLAADVIGAPTP
jgi:hypothetical protein